MSYAPVLTEQQIARIRALSLTRDVAADEVLYEPNDATPPVYVVLSGAISIYAGGSGDVQLRAAPPCIAAGSKNRGRSSNFKLAICAR
jgi:CRP-like cAMP-binding protein